MEFRRRKNGPITLSGYQRSSANPNQPTNEMTMKKNESSDDLRLPDEERLERIAQAFDAQRRQLNFVHSNLFFAAGWISLLTLTAQFMLDTLLGAAWLWYLLWLPAGIAGVALLLIRRDKHRTVTLTDRSLLNVWLFAIGVTGYTAFYLDGRLPIAGFLTIGMAIAVAFTSELFRRNESGRLTRRTANGVRRRSVPRGLDFPRGARRPDPNAISAHLRGRRPSALGNWRRTALSRTPKTCLENSIHCCTPSSGSR